MELLIALSIITTISAFILLLQVLDKNDAARRYKELLSVRDITISTLQKDLNARKDEIKKLQEQIEELSGSVTYYKGRCEDWRSKYNELCVKHDELSKKAGHEFYRETIEYLFPNRIVYNADENSIWFNSYVKMLTGRMDLIDKYKSELRRLEGQYDPYFCMVFAKAYSNKIIHDWYYKEFDPVTVLPVAAAISSELKTLYLESKAQILDWGNDKHRARKVEVIRELRQRTKEQLEQASLASYQLQYLLSLYPQLEDLLEIEFKDLEYEKDSTSLEEFDRVRKYISREEYCAMSESERNQLALDRYIESHSKSKWQIGRDYEQYIGWRCEQLGFSVDYTGMSMKLEDMGRDLVVSSGKDFYIIQCKYWSKHKNIHEKHIMQLYGSIKAYEILNANAPKVTGVLVTSASLSETATLFAKTLGIQVYEDIPIQNYPRIKCNINRDDDGNVTKIYHLPMDLSYDTTKINKTGEFMAFTVSEAESAGFRRSYKYYFSKSSPED